MKTFLIHYDSNNFTVKTTKAPLLIYRIEISIYIIAYALVMFLIYTKSNSDVGVRLGVMTVFTVSLLIVIAIKLRSLFPKDFYLTKTDNGIIVNNNIKVTTLSVSAIRINESVDTYSARSYYDISIKVGSRRVHIAHGANASDKATILEGLRSFLVLPDNKAIDISQ